VKFEALKSDNKLNSSGSSLFHGCDAFYCTSFEEILLPIQQGFGDHVLLLRHCIQLFEEMYHLLESREPISRIMGPTAEPDRNVEKREFRFPNFPFEAAQISFLHSCTAQNPSCEDKDQSILILQ
jgi:hypothetical protein